MFRKDIPVPALVPQMIVQLMQGETITVGDTGVDIEWPGPNRCMTFEDDAIVFTPPMKVTKGLLRVAELSTVLRRILVRDSGTTLRLDMAGPDYTFNLVTP